MSELLEIKNLTLELGDPEQPVRAIDQLDLTIRKGETFALLGESGCGKSMTALSIMRLLPESGRITSGSIMLSEESLLQLPEVEMRRRRGGKVAMIFQEPMTSLNPVMTAGEQIAESVRLHQSVSKNEVRDKVHELMTDVGIPDVERRYEEYPHQLSGGIKQRIMIAMALAGEPDLLIADEPTTALDVTIQAQVLSLLKSLQKSRGMSILLITHDLGVVAEMADRVAIMYAGQIIEVSDVNTFFEQPKHPYSHKLFSSLPNTNKRGQPLNVIKGMVPRLDQTFNRCRFLDRCTVSNSSCETELPPWKGEEQLGYRCFLEHQDIATLEEDVAVVESVIALDNVSETVLNIEDLKVYFPIKKGIFRKTVGHVKAVDGVTLELKAGQTLALVGESGCGKTTVGKGILQLLDSTEGKVVFEGEDLTTLSASDLRKKRKDLQIIFQDPASSMNPRMLVGDIVAEGIVAQGLIKDKQKRKERVAQLLKQVGLPEEAMLRYPHEFSGGQRQRICIARSLAVNPKVIVCDEPTSALDVSVQAQVLNLLKDLQRDLGLAYLFITHDISVVSYLADEIAVMYLGRIVEKGKVEQVLENPLHPYTQALLSSVPVPDPKAKSERVILEGDMPSPSNPPSGCHFHPRCPQAMDECQLDYPQALITEDKQQVSCLLYK